MEYKYIGCFINFQKFQEAIKSLPAVRLDRVIEHPHITFVYRPDSVDTSLFGEPMDITVVGYGNDGTNEGLLVELGVQNPTLAAMAKRIPVPHITISVSADGQPVDTAKLTFSPMEPFSLMGYFGGFKADDSVDTQVK